MTKFTYIHLFLTSFSTLIQPGKIQPQKYLCESTCKDMTNAHESVDMVFTVRDRAVDQCYGVIHRNYQKNDDSEKKPKKVCEVNKRVINASLEEQDSWDQVCKSSVELGCHFHGNNCLCAAGLCDSGSSDYSKCRVNRPFFAGLKKSVELGWVQACKNVGIGCAFDGMNCLCLEGVCLV